MNKASRHYLLGKRQRDIFLSCHNLLVHCGDNDRYQTNDLLFLSVLIRGFEERYNFCEQASG